MMKEKPLVTIFTLVYNTSEYVIPALQCIKEQLYQPVEHIIVDDHSTDNSVQVIQNWIQENQYECEYIVHEKNKGICASINEIILKAKGKYIYGVSDDLMMPDKLIKDVEYLEANPSFAFCSTSAIYRYVKQNKDEKIQFRPTTFKDLIFGKSIISAVTVVYKRQVLIDIGLFDDTLFFEDLDMFLRILDKYPVGFRNDYSVIYCVHEKSVQQKYIVKFQEEFFNIYKKWRHLHDYKLFNNNRHLYVFWLFSVSNKKVALRHLLPAATYFWRPTFLKALIKFIFIHKKKGYITS